jgi:hypothetical protein
MRTVLLAAILSGAALPGSVAPASAQLDSVPQRTEDWAQRQLENFVATWSRDEGVTRAAVERLYAPRVIYYGRPMSRDAILADKRAYIAHWPRRRYEIAPGSVNIRCTGDKSICRATAVMRWTRSDHAGRTVSGASRMSFLVSKETGGKIVREGAVTLR